LTSSTAGKQGETESLYMITMSNPLDSLLETLIVPRPPRGGALTITETLPYELPIIALALTVLSAACTRGIIISYQRGAALLMVDCQR